MNRTPRRHPRGVTWRPATAGLLVTGAIALALIPTTLALASTRYWVNPDSAVVRWVASHPGDGRTSVIRDRIADVPQATWLSTFDPSSARSDVEGIISRSAAAGATPILVLYNIPDRDCRRASAGGAPDHGAYRAWVDQVAAGLSGARAVVVVEPDALALLPECKSVADQNRTLASLGYAVRALTQASSNVRVFVDAGNSAWTPPQEMAQRLIAVGIRDGAAGIATNVSNYHATANERAYAHAVLDAIGDPSLKAVIDTGRNGLGSNGQWCDPTTRGLGERTTSLTFDPRIEAYLWIKPPGEADGCAAPAGTFLPQRAYEQALAQVSAPATTATPTVSPTPTPSVTPTPTPTPTPTLTPTPTPTVTPVSPTPTASASPTPTASAATGDPLAAACTVTGRRVSAWPGGRQVEVTITASAPISAWSVQWELGADESLAHLWNAAPATQGRTVIATGLDWNGSLARGQSTTIGYLVNSSSNASPDGPWTCTTR